jgi:hypothetical protein
MKCENKTLKGVAIPGKPYPNTTLEPCSRPAAPGAVWCLACIADTAKRSSQAVEQMTYTGACWCYECAPGFTLSTWCCVPCAAISVAPSQPITSTLALVATNPASPEAPTQKAMSAELPC